MHRVLTASEDNESKGASGAWGVSLGGGAWGGAWEGVHGV